MRVRGLNEDLYLINNPLLIEIDQLEPGVSIVEISVSSEGLVDNPPLRLYVLEDGITYNLSELIKGNFEWPAHPETPQDNQPINTNYREFRIHITEVREDGSLAGTTTLTRTFIRGGRVGITTNETLQPGQVLQVTQKIPRWGGYPIAQYYIENKEIKFQGIVPSRLTEERPVVGCEPLYVRFLNSLGGYSFYLFESYTEALNNQSEGKINDYTGSKHIGLETSMQVTARTKVNRRYFDLIRDLFYSPEVYFFEKYGREWARVQVMGNSFDVNNMRNVKDVEISFEVENTYNPLVIW